MTALVGWTLAVDPGPHDGREIDAAVEAALTEEGDELLRCVSYGVHSAEPQNRYDPTQDVVPLSERFPGALFTLTATDCENHNPPEEHGYRRVYLAGGLAQQAVARVVFSPFDPEALEP